MALEIGPFADTRVGKIAPLLLRDGTEPTYVFETLVLYEPRTFPDAINNRVSLVISATPELAQLDTEARSIADRIGAEYSTILHDSNQARVKITFDGYNRTKLWNANGEACGVPKTWSGSLVRMRCKARCGWLVDNRFGVCVDVADLRFLPAPAEECPI
jgi:hypothetical protein